MIINQCENILYSDWVGTPNASFMQDEDFFIGSGDSVVDLMIRESAYDYILDVFGSRHISLMDDVIWSSKYKAALRESGNTFWRLIDAENTSRVADLVTADYTEEISNFSTSVGRQMGKQSSSTSTTGSSHTAGAEDADAFIQTTSGNRTGGGQTTTQTTEGDRNLNPIVITEETQEKPERTVAIASNLAEATYAGTDIPGDGNVETESDLVPFLDTTHGDTAQGSWRTSGERKTEIINTSPTGTETVTQTIEYTSPTGDDTVTTGPIKSKYEDVSSNVNSSSYGAGDTRESINDNISGTRRSGRRDFNGYNLTASVQAILGLAPYDYLRQRLGRMFSAF